MSLFESQTPLTEAELLDRCPLQGRKTELKQLLKALTLCKTGQGKAILISGNEGIGKTAVLDAFADLAQSHLSTPVIRLVAEPEWTPRLLFTRLVEGILDQAQDILTVALDEANRILSPLEMRWTEADLVRMVAMTHLQESNYGRDQADLAALAETIKRAIPFFRRMTLPVQDQLDQLGRLMVHPWVVMAASLLNPLNPSMQAARDLLDPACIQSRASVPLLGGVSEGDGDYQDEVVAAEAVTLEKLVSTLVSLLTAMNRGLQQQSAWVLLVDQWERVMETPETVRHDLKAFWVELLRQTTDQRDFRLMAVLSCRSEAESYVLGGPIYNAFRLKYLISPLGAVQQKKTLKAWAQAEALSLSDEVQDALVHLSQGNPAWLKLAWQALSPEFAAGMVTPEKLVQRYQTDSPAPFLELLFTRVQLDFIGEESNVLRLLGRLIQQVGPRSFDRSRLMALCSGITDANPDWVERLITVMVQNGLMHRLADGQVCLAGAFVLGWLRHRIQPVQEDVPSQDKLSSLKTVLPLAIQSDELTREKLFEMLSMASALDDLTMVTFVEATMAEAALNDETPASARLVVVEGLGVLATPTALEALVTLLDTSQPDVLKAVCHQWTTLSRLPQARRFEDAVWARIEPMLAQSDISLRHDAWQWMALTDSLAQPILKALREGAESTDATVRLSAYAGLCKRGDTDARWLETLRKQLHHERDPAMTKAILKCLAVFPTETVVGILKGALQTQGQSPVYGDLLNALIQLDWRAALPWVSAQLTPDSPLDLRLQVLRKLGQQPGYEAETILINHLKHENLPAEERWMAIRSLGWAGITRRALTTLETQKALYAQNDIVAHSLDVALNQLSLRLATIPPELEPQSTSHSVGASSTPVPSVTPPSWYQPARAQADSSVIELIPAMPPETFDQDQ